MSPFLRTVLVAVLMSGAAAAAFAGVYQCKSANGSVIFSDRPCPKGDTGGEIAVKPSTGMVPRGATDRAGSGNTVVSNRSESAIVQACLKLHRRMEEAAKNSRTSESEREELVNRYVMDCLPLDQAILEQGGTRQKRDADVANRHSACDAKRKVVAERRARWQGLSEAERNTVVMIEKELAHECR